MAGSSLIADTFNHRFIEPVHLLIALTHEHRGIGAKVLHKHGLRESDLLKLIDTYGLELNLGSSRPRISPKLQEVLQIAVNESISTKTKPISSGHLLVALTKIQDNRVRQTFIDAGVDVGSVCLDVYEKLRR